jgi:hypothetical protein
MKQELIIDQTSKFFLSDPDLKPVLDLFARNLIDAERLKNHLLILQSIAEARALKVLTGN